jgi:methyltransferase (TIGR00027 family)
MRQKKGKGKGKGKERKACACLDYFLMAAGATTTAMPRSIDLTCVNQCMYIYIYLNTPITHTQHAHTHARAHTHRASQGVGRKIAVRTRFFDDFLLDACGLDAKPPRQRKRQWLRRLFSPLGRMRRLLLWRHRDKQEEGEARRGAIKQVLILGCGMDTRAWRLPLHDTIVVEVDVAPVLRAKDAVLKAVQAQRRRGGEPDIPLTVRERRAIAADFADPGDDWVHRVERVVDVTQPVAVVLEGLLMYLDEGEVRALLQRVSALAAAPGSRVGISLVDWRSVRDAQASSSPLRRSWKWGCDEARCRGFFERALSGGDEEGRGRGEWRVGHVTKVGNKGAYPDGANYGCWKNVGKWKRVGKTLYVLAERRRRRRRGRAWLEKN